MSYVVVAGVHPIRLCTTTVNQYYAWQGSYEGARRHMCVECTLLNTVQKSDTNITKHLTGIS